MLPTVTQFIIQIDENFLPFCMPQLFFFYLLNKLYGKIRWTPNSEYLYTLKILNVNIDGCWNELKSVINDLITIYNIIFYTIIWNKKTETKKLLTLKYIDFVITHNFMHILYGKFNRKNKEKRKIKWQNKNQYFKTLSVVVRLN